MKHPPDVEILPTDTYPFGLPESTSSPWCLT